MARANAKLAKDYSHVNPFEFIWVDVSHGVFRFVNVIGFWEANRILGVV